MDTLNAFRKTIDNEIEEIMKVVEDRENEDYTIVEKHILKAENNSEFDVGYIYGLKRASEILKDILKEVRK